MHGIAAVAISSQVRRAEACTIAVSRGRYGILSVWVLVIRIHDIEAQ